MPKLYKALVFFFIVSILFFRSYVVVQSVSPSDPGAVTGTMEITASISPKATDYQFDFSSDQTAEIPPDTDIDYTITYGSSLPIGTPQITIEAEWFRGSPEGQNLNVFDIVSYVSGSATNGYGNAKPTIDLANRKIIWKISNFPKKTTNQTVSFTLRTPAHQVTDQKINFSVKARFLTDKVTLQERTVKQTYTPISIKPPGEITALELIGLEIRQVGNTSFSILIKTNQPTKITVFFGKTRRLGQRLQNLELSQQKVILIEGLDSATAYYFKVQVENKEGQSFTTPEFYIVRTASKSLISTLDEERLLISLPGIKLKDRISTGEDAAVLLLPETGLNVFLPFDPSSPPVEVFLKIVNKQVLGINNLEPLPFLERIRILETEPGIFSGKIKVPPELGVYDLILEIRDINGNFLQDTLLTLRVAEHIKILSKAGEPIEGARLYLEILNPRTRIFERFPAESFGYRNPIFSDVGGEVHIHPPQGQYRVEIKAIGYKNLKKDFYFSANLEKYPTFNLEKSPFSLLTAVQYYASTATDVYHFATINIKKLSASKRFFDLTAGVTMALLVSLTFFSFRSRTHISLGSLPLYFYCHIQLLFSKSKRARSLKIKVTDKETGHRISKARVHLIGGDKNKIIARSLTNKIGEAYFLRIPSVDFCKVAIMKKGYESSLFFEHSKKRLISGELNLELKKMDPEELSIIDNLHFFIENIIGLSFEALLILSLLLEVLLISSFGLVKTLPFLTISLLNLIVWIIHLRHSRQEVRK